MADERLNPLFWWHPYPIPDPAPEIYSLLNSLPSEVQAQVVTTISEARAQIERARGEAYAKLGEIFASRAGGGTRSAGA